MKVLIINLKKSTERFDFQVKQCQRLGITFERLDAVSVDDFDEAFYQKNAFGWQRPLRPVELACFLSHKKAWQTVVEYNQPCLIIEDDAIFARILPDILAELDKKTGIDLINFENRSRKKIISKTPVDKLLHNVKLYELYQDRTGTGGYILYPSGAKKLLARTQNHAPATADGFLFASYELKALQCEPALLIQEDQLGHYGLINEQNFISTIGRSEHHKPRYKNFAEKVKFKKRRITAQFTMAFRAISVFFYAQKRFIDLNKEWFK